MQNSKTTCKSFNLATFENFSPLVLKNFMLVTFTQHTQTHESHHRPRPDYDFSSPLERSKTIRIASQAWITSLPRLAGVPWRGGEEEEGKYTDIASVNRPRYSAGRGGVRWKKRGPWSTGRGVRVARSWLIFALVRSLLSPSHPKATNTFTNFVPTLFN